jgi:hypothetical protein
VATQGEAPGPTDGVIASHARRLFAEAESVGFEPAARPAQPPAPMNAAAESRSATSRGTPRAHRVLAVPAHRVFAAPVRGVPPSQARRRVGQRAAGKRASVAVSATCPVGLEP